MSPSEEQHPCKTQLKGGFFMRISYVIARKILHNMAY